MVPLPKLFVAAAGAWPSAESVRHAATIMGLASELCVRPSPTRRRPSAPRGGDQRKHKIEVVGVFAVSASAPPEIAQSSDVRDKQT